MILKFNILKEFQRSYTFLWLILVIFLCRQSGLVECSLTSQSHLNYAEQCFCATNYEIYATTTSWAVNKIVRRGVWVIIFLKYFPYATHRDNEILHGMGWDFCVKGFVVDPLKLYFMQYLYIWQVYRAYKYFREIFEFHKIVVTSRFLWG